MSENFSTHPSERYAQVEALRCAEKSEICEDTAADLQVLQSECENTAESPEAREARLGNFVETHFADICPSEYVAEAVQECIYFEDELRLIFEDDNMNLEPEDAESETLQSKVIACVPKITQNDQLIEATENLTTETSKQQLESEQEKASSRENSEQIREENPDIPADEASRREIYTATQAQNTELQHVQEQGEKNLSEETTLTSESRESNSDVKNLNATETARNTSVSADRDTLENASARLQELKAEHGTIGALETLLSSGVLHAPEVIAKVKATLAMARSIFEALPGKSAILEQIFNQTNFDLSAGSMTEIFAGFIAEADKSQKLSDSDKAVIREAFLKQADIQTGSDMQTVLDTGRGVTTLPDGSLQKIPYTKENPAKISEGQTLFETERGEKVLRVAIEDGNFFEFLLPENSAAEMGRVGIIAQVMDRLADYNLDGPIFQKGLQMQAGGRIRLDFPKDWVTTERILHVFFGETTGHDGALLTDRQLYDMEYQLQGLCAKGDAARADGNTEMAYADLTKLGVLDQTGDLDWARFENIISHNRDKRYSGMTDFEINTSL